MRTASAFLTKSKPWDDYCDGERPLKQAIEKLVKLKRPAVLPEG
jgi:bifunctional non-homologous end joining protein LigD